MSEQTITKTCRVCKQTKPLTEFYKNQDSKDGHRNKCKICHLKSIKEYSQTEEGKIAHRKANLRYNRTEKGKAATKRYAKGEKFKVQQKRYQQSEKGNATKDRYLQSAKGKATIRNRQRKESPEQIKARSAVSKAIKIGKLPRPDTLKCSCGEKAKQYHHHKGYAPEHWLDVVPICRKCHIHYTSASIAGEINS